MNLKMTNLRSRLFLQNQSLKSQTFFSLYKAKRETEETLTTLNRTPGISPTAFPLRPNPAISTSSWDFSFKRHTFSSIKLRQPSLGTKAVTFFAFLINCARIHLRMAELGCLDSIPLEMRRVQNFTSCPQQFPWRERLLQRVMTCKQFQELSCCIAYQPIFDHDDAFVVYGRPEDLLACTYRLDHLIKLTFPFFYKGLYYIRQEEKRTNITLVALLEPTHADLSIQSLSSPRLALQPCPLKNK